MTEKEALLNAELRTTSLGETRIRQNLDLQDSDDALCFCNGIIHKESAQFERKGKNWYITEGNVRITVNAFSHTIITAHKLSSGHENLSNKDMNPEYILSQRTNITQIESVAEWVSGNQARLRLLRDLVRSADRRTSANALWTMTRLHDQDSGWLLSLRDEMTDMLLKETDTGKKRMLLRILRNQEYEADDIRTDFLDWCLSKINSECEPYAVRCFSIYCAFKMCRHYPELLDELEEHLVMMAFQPLSPGLKSALRQTKTKIRKLGPAQSRR